MNLPKALRDIASHVAEHGWEEEERTMVEAAKYMAELELALEGIVLDRETYVNNPRSLFRLIDSAKGILERNKP